MSHDVHELEPIPGLPRPLPPGERILWQGRPTWRGLARSPFHLGWLALYLGAVVAARGVGAWTATHRSGAALVAALTVFPLALVCLALVLGLAVLHARATVYTLTTRRVVMRFGIALPMSFNVPFRRIASAALRTGPRGEGDIVLRLSGPGRLAYAHLWPHVQPWSVRRPEPMLRALPDATRVAELLREAVQAWAEAESRPAGGVDLLPDAAATVSAPEPARAAAGG